MWMAGDIDDEDIDTVTSVTDGTTAPCGRILQAESADIMNSISHTQRMLARLTTATALLLGLGAAGMTLTALPATAATAAYVVQAHSPQYRHATVGTAPPNNTNTGPCTASIGCPGTLPVGPGYAAGTGPAQSCTQLPSGTVVGMVATTDNNGYWIANSAGLVDACGDASTTYGELTSAPSSPIMGITASSDAQGYWLVAANGAVYAFGDAQYYGALNKLPANEQPGVPVVGLAADQAGTGYWEVTSEGDVYSFGSAQFQGSTGNITLNKPIVGMALDPKTGGYWLDASDGGIFAFHAPFKGSMGRTPLNMPAVGMAPDLATGGYWLVAADGGIFSFDAPFYGSTSGLHLAKPIVGMEAAANGSGYRVVASDGGVFDFGSSPFEGSAA